MNEPKRKDGKPCARRRLGISYAVWMKTKVAKRWYIALSNRAFPWGFGVFGYGFGSLASGRKELAEVVPLTNSVYYIISRNFVKTTGYEKSTLAENPIK